MSDQQLDLLAAVADNPHPLADRDRKAILEAIRKDAHDHGGRISTNRVRRALSNQHGLTVHPRALSAAYSSLARRKVIVSLGYIDVNDDERGNAGKPCRAWQWVDWTFTV